MQDVIELNDKEIPIMREGGTIYYPISYLGDKILFKSLSPSQLRNNGYGKYISNYMIKYDDKNIQDTYCISENGLKQMLFNCKPNRLSIEQKQAMKSVCKYLRLNIKIDTQEKFLDSFDDWHNYDFWSKECIEAYLKFDPNVKWQRCSKCGKYYPYDEHFYEKEGNPNNKCELRTICKTCKGWNSNRSRIEIQHINKNLHQIYKKYGIQIYLMFKTKDYLNIWKWLIDTHNKIPNYIKNKTDILDLLKTVYDNKIIEQSQLNNKEIYKLIGFNINQIHIVTKDICSSILNIEIKTKDGYGIDNFEDAKMVFLDYVNKQNVNITYETDLWKLIRDCGLINYIKKNDNDILKFVLNVYNYKFLSYKFVGYAKHWKVKENRDIALKQLIETEMNLNINKIPLYLTLENLRKQSETLRNLLRKYYDNNLWLWINEIYPNKFIEEDFNISVIRNYFDSIEEEQIDQKLRESFDNVIYNKRNTKNTIKIVGSIPDWFVFKDNGVWVIEYFGIAPAQKIYNKRVNDYISKSKIKIEKYSHTKGYNFIYLYPEDLKDNYKGLSDKISLISK